MHDGWTDIARRIRDRVVSNGEFTPEALMRAFSDADFEKMDEIRARVDTIVGDQATAAALKPWYRQLCKRPCFHDEYLDAYNEPGTHLIDTDGQGVERITPTGVVVAGVEYEVDCIVFASGFEVGTELTRRTGFDVTGRDGVTLSGALGRRHAVDARHARPRVPQRLRGRPPPRPPTSSPTTPTTCPRPAARSPPSWPTPSRSGRGEVEVTAEAEEAWVDLILSSERMMIGSNPDCTPGYYNNEGQDPGLRGKLNGSGYPGGPVAFFEFIDRWRTDGAFEGLEIRS